MGDGDGATLTVACRFTTLDQWLTTHVGSSWKVKHVKVWLLAKCLAIPLASSVLDDNTRASGLGTKKRSASPITFAPDPRRRPVSPIRFAKGNKKTGRTGRAENTGSRPATPGSVGNADTHLTDDDVVGYDEDDEDYLSDGDEDEATNVTRVEDGAIPPFISETDLAPSVQAEINLTSNPAWMKYNSDAKSYTLIRFTTGQILEDEYSLAWYELSPYELLEMHAHLPVQALPPSFTKTPGAISHSSHPSTSSSHQKHRRHASLYSLAGSESHNAQFSNGLVALHRGRFMAPLDRQSVTNYVQPYWEGYVRALRVVWKEDPESVANFENGYGLGYMGAPFPKGGDPSGKDPPDHYMGRKRVLEWCLKWAVIKDGNLNLSKSPEDTTPTHVLPLDSLTALRNNEQLFNHPQLADPKEPAKPPFMRSPYPPRPPPKDKLTRKDKDKDKGKVRPEERAHRLLALADPQIGSPKPKRSNRSHMSSMSMSMSSTMSRESTTSDDDEDTAHDTHSTSDYWGGKRRGSLLPKDFSFGSAGTSTHHSNASGLSQSWSEKSGMSGHSHNSSRLHLVGGEPVDDLKVVCIKYKSSKRLHAQMGIFAHRDLGADVEGAGGAAVKGKEKSSGDTEGSKGTSLWRSDTDKKEKGKGKGRRLLQLGKDDKDKDKEKEKTRKLKSKPPKDKDKEKGKERDWISALAGGTKGKDKGKGKEKGKEGSWASSTLTPENTHKFSSRSQLELGSSTPQRYGPQVADEEPTSTIPSPVHRCDQVEDSPASSPGGAIRFARFAPEEKLDSSDEENGEEPEDEGDDGQYDTFPNTIDDDNTSDLGPHTGPAAGMARSDAASDANVNAEGQAPRPTHTRKKASISSHTHPFEELQELEHDISSDIGSSPKFAHSEDTDDDGSDVPDSRRQGYRYGYQYETVEAARWGPHEYEQLHEHEDRMEKEKINYERRRRKELARKKAEEKEKERQDWLVLDMGSDLAFQSFLRILHRHLIPPVQSSFVNVPNYATPHASRSPTPTPTPYPSPISPHALMHTQPFQWTENPESDEDFPRESKSSIVQSSSATIAATASSDSLSAPRSAGSASSQDDRFQLDASSQHPAALAALSSHPPATVDSLGVLPYPEWRMEVTERAQRAGLGEIGRGLRWILGQDQHQLDLDLHEVRNRDIVDEETSAELRKLRRETLSLKYRRQSSTSATPTITGGKSTKSIGSGSSQKDVPSQSALATYDSDVSEETGKLIDDSDGEASEAEWVGWTADLHRQYRTQEQQKREKEQSITTDSHRESNMLYPPRNLTEDRLTMITRRRALEPIASVYIPPIMPTPPVMTTPAPYTASSSEDLYQQRTRAGFSPADRSSSPPLLSTTQSSLHSYSNSQTTSPLGNTPYFSRRQFSPGSSLSHSTSMYAGLRSSTSAALHAQRRPSMPSLLDTAAANSSTFKSILRSPGASQTSFPKSKHTSVPFSPSFSSFHTSESSSSRPKDIPEGSQSVTKRGSFLGIKGKDRDPASYDQGKAKERAEPYDVDGPPDGTHTPRPQRPKLSLTTSTSQPPSMSTALESRSTQASTSQARLRHVKSNSSFAGATTTGDEEATSSREQRPPRKKRTLAQGMEKIAKKLDSAIDFVDGSW